MKKSVSKSVLVISYVFPPNAAVGVYRILNLCNFLVGKGYNVSVLTIKNPVCYAKDEKLVTMIHPDLQIFRTSAPSLFTLSNSLWNKIKTGITNLLTWPLRKWKYALDPTYLWIVPAVMKGLYIIKKNKVNVIISSSPPPSVHLISLLLKKITGIKIIEDFRDLYATKATEQNNEDSVEGLKNSFEQKMVLGSDAITVTSQYARMLMLKKYPAARIYTVYNGFNPSDFDRIRPVQYDKYTIIHLGSFYDGRTPEPLLKALKYLYDQEETRSVVDQIQCVFIGNKISKYRWMIEEASQWLRIKDYEHIPHMEALNYLFGADLNYLVLDEDRPEVIPAKIFEYLKSGNPILPVLPEGEVANWLHEIGNPVFRHEDIPRIAQYVQDLANGKTLRLNQKKKTTMINNFRRHVQIQSLMLVDMN